MTERPIDDGATIPMAYVGCRSGIAALAALEDLLCGKVWGAQDIERRGSKRQKDRADMARLLESHPDLRSQVPQEILNRLL